MFKYVASKAALIALKQKAQLTVRKKNVRVLRQFCFLGP